MDISMISSYINQKAEFVENALKDKYGLEFKVTKIGNSHMGSKGEKYSVYCVPENDSDLVFKANVLSSKIILDDYEKALMGESIKKEIEQIVGSTVKEYRVITIVQNNADGYRSNINISDFVKSNNPEIYIVLILNTDKTLNLEPDYIYSLMEEICTAVGQFNGGFDLYYVEEESMEKVIDLTNENPEVSSILLGECGDGFNTLVNGGVMVKSKQDLIEALY